jgi:hypothetical protein
VGRLHPGPSKNKGLGLPNITSFWDHIKATPKVKQTFQSKFGMFKKIEKVNDRLFPQENLDKGDGLR